MATTTSDEHWLSVGEAGRALGLSRTSLLAAEEAGLLASIRTPGGHRRYHPVEVRRYLDAAGMGSMPAPRPAADGPAARDSPAARESPAARDRALPEQRGRDTAAWDMAAVVRLALRPLVGLLDASSGGLYLVQGATLRFCTAFGVPRWLTERLAAEALPPALARVLDTGRPRLFDPGAAAFPEPRSTGHGVAVAVPGVQGPHGVLFVVLPIGHSPLPAELRTVDAFAQLVGLIVADRREIAELECRLAHIATLSASGPGRSS